MNLAFHETQKKLLGNRKTHSFHFLPFSFPPPPLFFSVFFLKFDNTFILCLFCLVNRVSSPALVPSVWLKYLIMFKRFFFVWSLFIYLFIFCRGHCISTLISTLCVLYLAVSSFHFEVSQELRMPTQQQLLTPHPVLRA